MKQAHSALRAKLVPQTSSLPVAQEPPIPIVTSSGKAPKAKRKTAKEEMAEFQRGNLWAALQDPMSAEHPRAQREFSRIAAAIAKEKAG